MTRALDQYIEKAEAAIGYTFKDKQLLVQALTHASATQNQKLKEKNHYERLEFLGDRVLGLVISHRLFTQKKDISEGELSRALAQMVRAETCAAVAQESGIESFIRLGEGETKGFEKKSSRIRRSILSDVCEALLGALYLDGGLSCAESWVDRYWSGRLMELSEAERDPKTRLQEWAQSRKLALPSYALAKRDGPDHAPNFSYRVTLEGHGSAIGSGPSRKIAESVAARVMLSRLTKLPSEYKS